MNVEREVSMHALGQLRIGPLTHVHAAVHFGRHVDGHLHGGQFAAVEPGLGKTGYAVGNLRALMPPGHLHSRIAGRRLARDRRLHTWSQFHRIVFDVQVVG